MIAESYESGETVSAVARRHELTPQQLFLAGAVKRVGLFLLIQCLAFHLCVPCTKGPSGSYRSRRRAFGLTV